MLMANISVAKKIYESFPKVSVLRRHPPPSAKILSEVVRLPSIQAFQFCYRFLISTSVMLLRWSCALYWDTH